MLQIQSFHSPIEKKKTVWTIHSDVIKGSGHTPYPGVSSAYWDFAFVFVIFQFLKRMAVNRGLTTLLWYSFFFFLDYKPLWASRVLQGEFRSEKLW